MSKVVFVIAKKNFRDEELFHPLQEIKNAGNIVIIASIEKGECIGAKGGIINAEIELNEINEKDFDGIVFVGGAGSAQYFNNEKALILAKNFFNAGKVIAAICIAPSILANAGLLNGVKVTSFVSEKNHLIEKGAEFTGNEVEVSGKIITASGPKSAKEFGKKINELLK
jgi:protease I